MGAHFCPTPNFLSSVLAPAVERRSPQPDSISAGVLDHLNNVGPLLKTVSQGLCDDGRTESKGAMSEISLIARGATTTAVTVGTLGIATLGLVVESTLLALATGVIGVAVLPPFVRRIARGVSGFAGKLLKGAGKTPRCRYIVRDPKERSPP
jgi:hypothetical protein